MSDKQENAANQAEQAANQPQNENNQNNQQTNPEETPKKEETNPAGQIETKKEEGQSSEDQKIDFDKNLIALLEEVATLKTETLQIEELALENINKDYDGLPHDLHREILSDYEELYHKLLNDLKGSKGTYENMKLLEALQIDEQCKAIRKTLGDLRQNIKEELTKPKRNIDLIIQIERLNILYSILNSNTKLSRYLMLKEAPLVSAVVDKNQDLKNNDVIKVDVPMLAHETILLQGSKPLYDGETYITHVDDMIYYQNHYLDISGIAFRLLVENKTEISNDISDAFYKAIPPRTLMKVSPYSSKNEIRRDLEDCKYSLFGLEKRAYALSRFNYPYPGENLYAIEKLQSLFGEAKDVSSKLETLIKKVREYEENEAGYVEKFIGNARTQIKTLLSERDTKDENLNSLVDDMLNKLKKSINANTESGTESKPEEKSAEKTENKDQASHHEEVAEENSAQPVQEPVQKKEINDTSPKAGQPEAEIKKEEIVEATPEKKKPEENTSIEATPVKEKVVRAGDSTAAKSGSTEATNISPSKYDNPLESPAKRAFGSDSPYKTHYRQRSTGVTLGKYELDRSYMDYIGKISRSPYKPRGYYY